MRKEHRQDNLSSVMIVRAFLIDQKNYVYNHILQLEINLNIILKKETIRILIKLLNMSAIIFGLCLIRNPSDQLHRSKVACHVICCC